MLARGGTGVVACARGRPGLVVLGRRRLDRGRVFRLLGILGPVFRGGPVGVRRYRGGRGVGGVLGIAVQSHIVGHAGGVLGFRGVGCCGHRRSRGVEGRRVVAGIVALVVRRGRLLGSGLRCVVMLRRRVVRAAVIGVGGRRGLAGVVIGVAAIIALRAVAAIAATATAAATAPPAPPPAAATVVVGIVVAAVVRLPVFGLIVLLCGLGRCRLGCVPILVVLVVLLVRAVRFGGPVA